MSKLMTTKELAEYFGVTHQTIYNWINAGMPHLKLGAKTNRYLIEDVMKWVSDREVQ